MPRVMGDMAAANLAVAALYGQLGGQIATARKSRGITQQYLAAAVGLTRTSLTNIEAGRQRPPLHVVIAIAQALDVEPSALISGDTLPCLAPKLATPLGQVRRALTAAQNSIAAALDQIPPEE